MQNKYNYAVHSDRVIHFTIERVSILTGNILEVEKNCNRQSVHTLILALESVIITFDRKIR